MFWALYSFCFFVFLPIGVFKQGLDPVLLSTIGDWFFLCCTSPHSCLSCLIVVVVLADYFLWVVLGFSVLCFSWFSWSRLLFFPVLCFGLLTCLTLSLAGRIVFFCVFYFLLTSTYCFVLVLVYLSLLTHTVRARDGLGNLGNLGQ